MADSCQKPTFSLGITTPFSVKPSTVVWVKISEKKKPINFHGLKTLYLPKYGHLMLPGEFLHKITPVTDFTDEAVVQCDIPVVKILF